MRRVERRVNKEKNVQQQQQQQPFVQYVNKKGTDELDCL